MNEYIGIFIATVFFGAILVLYFLYITRPQKKKSSRASGRIDRAMAKNKWEEIQAMMKSGGPANYRQSIMEADKLVDLVLRAKVPGETMGERLKNARNLFDRDTYDKLWTAHKIRNKVAHEADFDGLGSDAILAVRNFEKALKELRVI